MPWPRRSTRWIAEEFDRRAPTYDGSSLHRWQATHAAAMVDLIPGHCVLDVATGIGLAAREATAQGGPGTTAVGVDLSDGMLRVAVAQTDPSRCGFILRGAWSVTMASVRLRTAAAVPVPALPPDLERPSLSADGARQPAKLD